MLVEVDGLAQSTLENIIWIKAETLVSEGVVVAVPWGADARDRFVKSSSFAAPLLVREDAKKRSYACDGNSPMFKGFSICSHVVATAELNGELQEFVDTSRVRVHLICRPLLIMGCRVGVVAREE